MSGVARAEGILAKFRRAYQIVKDNGGIRGSLYKFYRNDELKSGTLVGTDSFGNRYYENNMHFYGRNRWVDYTDRVGLNYDASQVPAEWHRWLHYITDKPPVASPPVTQQWLASHTENLTGTRGHYVPYSTTRPKIESWQPPKP